MIRERSQWLTFAISVGLAAVFSGISGCREKNPATDTFVPKVVKTASGIEMVSLPGGVFEMGSRSGEPDEAPVHTVRLSPFLMDRYEVTQSLYERFPLPNPSHFKGPDLPVEQMTWADAIEYCNERSRAEGLEECYNLSSGACNFEADGYRLPTEAEWEYACRAGSEGDYHFGNNEGRLGDYGWYKANAGRRTQPVGRKKPNRWGVYDMHGNIAEWCHDYYEEQTYRSNPENDPVGPASGRLRVLRGGSWNSTANACRSAYRTGNASLDDTCQASDTIGFRCVRRIHQKNSSPPSAGSAKPPIPVTLVSEKTIRERPSPPPVRIGFVYDKIYLQHLTGPRHPEAPERLTAILERLKREKLEGKLFRIAPLSRPERWITLVHTAGYQKRVAKSCRDGNTWLDSLDVPICAQTDRAAQTAVGGVLAAVDAVMQGKVKNAFCAIRPPGHHALPDRAMGFCIYNNVAIAARYLQSRYKLTRILIVDWDVHHGNGTQEIFYRDPQVFYFSVHQYPFYPGTGRATEVGAGPGKGTILNVPLSAGSDDGEYRRAFVEKLRPAALAFRPEFVLVSAGFDAQVNDLLGGMKVTPEGFAELTRIVKGIARQCCSNRLVSVLEGGYNTEQLAESVLAHLKVMMEQES